MRHPSLFRFIALAFVALLVLTIPAQAAVFVIPSDEELVARARGVLAATVVSQRTELAANGDVVTVTTFLAERAWKGEIAEGDSFEVHDLGGVFGNKAMGVSGGVTYAPGERVLVFLERNEAGQWTTWGMSLGKFKFVRRGGDGLLLREAGPHDLQLLDEQLRQRGHHVRFESEFLRRIDELTGNTGPKPPRRENPESEVAVPPSSVFSGAAATVGTTSVLDEVASDASGFPPSAYTLGTFRWQTFDTGGSVTFRVANRQPNYDDLGGAQRALAAWTNEPNSNVRYLYGGTISAGFVEDNRNTIVLNQSSGVPSGALAYAKWYAGDSHPYKGESFYSTIEGDVIVRSGLSVSQKVFDEMLTHELGHTLGFRHSETATPSSSNAVMRSSLTGNWGATLSSWDVDAVSTVYQATSTCTPPSITAQPRGLTITAGTPTTLSVTAAGTSPTYQWYIGTPGVTTRPVTGGTTRTITVLPTVTTTYWVRVTACGTSVNSTAAVVTVTSASGTNLRGDANGDGVVSATDVFFLTNHIFGGGPAPGSLCRGDANGDGVISATDVFFLTNHLFSGGPAPRAC